MRRKFRAAVTRVQRQLRARKHWMAAGAWAKRLAREVLRRAAGAGRTAATGARASTLRATVHSRERADVPMVVRHARRGQATRPRLHLAAAVGPVLVDMLDRYEVYAGLGDG